MICKRVWTGIFYISFVCVNLWLIDFIKGIPGLRGEKGKPGATGTKVRKGS